MESVRRAVPADLTRCRELVAAARSQSRSIRGAEQLSRIGMPGRRTWEGTPADPTSLVEQWSAPDPDRLLVVGDYAGATVGLAAAHVVDANTGRLGVIDFCYVEPGARQVGVGAAMVANLLAWVTERGGSDIDAVALPGDRATKQLFETAGFKARLLVLHRPLG